jgi:hypothetical protein
MTDTLVGRMRSQLGRWEGEDQPPFTGIDAWKAERLPEELASCGGILTEDDPVDSSNHDRASLDSELCQHHTSDRARAELKAREKRLSVIRAKRQPVLLHRRRSSGAATSAPFEEHKRLHELASRCRSRTGGAEVGVPELGLDQIHGDALARQLDGVCMPELVRREPAADSGLERESAQLATDGRA